MRHITLRLFVSLLTFFAGVSIHSVLQNTQERKSSVPIQQEAERNTVKWYVQQAKAKGESEVVIGGFRVCGYEFENMAEASSHDSIVVAQLLDKKSIVWEEREIETWYKFKVIENLNSKDFPEGEMYKNVPAELLPLQPDEFLVVKFGGAAIVDDIKVVSHSRVIPDSSITGQYLLFLKPSSYNHPAPTGRIGALPYGLGGVFTVSPSGDLEAALQEWHPLKDEVESRYKNSLDRLRAALKRRQNQPR
ncbi:MAG TPA: hypothetical protein VM943_08900 [Pyrinomonadaceae bacterium]|nr:hypothetical protein [Pyrinomonadaceae bacterium]